MAATKGGSRSGQPRPQPQPHPARTSNISEETPSPFYTGHAVRSPCPRMEEPLRALGPQSRAQAEMMRAKVTTATATMRVTIRTLAILMKRLARTMTG